MLFFYSAYHTFHFAGAHDLEGYDHSFGCSIKIKCPVIVVFFYFGMHF